MNEDVRVHVVECNDRRFLYMRYVDPITGKPIRRSTKTTKRRDAERAAAKWEAELREGRYAPSSKILWADFRDQYEDERLSGLAKATCVNSTSAMNHLERLIGPKRLCNLTSAAMSRFQAELRKTGIADATIRGHLKHLRAALSWAATMGMLAKVPEMHMPHRAKGRKLMKGRPITAEEFERMLAAVPKIRPKDPGHWQRYLTGLWLSGLRLVESTVLSWDDEAPFAVDLSGRHPRFRIYAEAEKGHQDRLLPMTPDFAEFLLQTPPELRRGPVFLLLDIATDRPLVGRWVGQIVSRVGRKAGLVVDKAKGKYATAHDLRRSFASRWAPRVKPATLQLLMRHASIQTTMEYYVAMDTDDVADELWTYHQRAVSSLGSSRSEKAEILGEY